MHAFLFNETKDFLGLETLNHHVLAAKQGQEMRHTPAIRVEERDGMQFHGPAFDVESEANVHRVEIHISVSQHHALGIGARSTGIEKLG
jgi:hypothetical protein